MHLPMDSFQLNIKLAYKFNSNSLFEFKLTPIEKFQCDFKLYRKMNQRHGTSSIQFKILTHQLTVYGPMHKASCVGRVQKPNMGTNLKLYLDFHHILINMKNILKK